MVYVDYFFDTAPPDFEPSRGLFYSQMLKFSYRNKKVTEMFGSL